MILIRSICRICGTYMDNNFIVHYVTPCDLNEVADHEWISVIDDKESMND